MNYISLWGAPTSDLCGAKSKIIYSPSTQVEEVVVDLKISWITLKMFFKDQSQKELWSNALLCDAFHFNAFLSWEHIFKYSNVNYSSYSHSTWTYCAHLTKVISLLLIIIHQSYSFGKRRILVTTKVNHSGRGNSKQVGKPSSCAHKYSNSRNLCILLLSTYRCTNKHTDTHMYLEVCTLTFIHTAPGCQFHGGAYHSPLGQVTVLLNHFPSSKTKVLHCI